VQFAARCGLVLVHRTPTRLALREPSGLLREYEILHEMPFSPELKRMGVMLRHCATDDITFYVKGADTAMAERIAISDWLEEEVGNLAREGLRTLVVACKQLSEQQYAEFAKEMSRAKLAKAGRSAAVRAVFDSLQEEMQLLCITAVEDRLQANVRPTLELLRDANVKTWMLTGDKLETAQIVAQNASLVAKHQPFYKLTARSERDARQQLQGYPQGVINAPCLILDGSTLELCTAHHVKLFVEVACAAPSVIVCRCTPTQKAGIVTLLRQHTLSTTAAIGDGGNDVAMIHAAHVGIGVEGREGRQAALASDFSISTFSHISRLILWHGRNCYLRSATLSQFIIHRGLIISFIQLVFSSLFYFRPIPLYSGLLVLGYATIFTTGPVFSLVLDEDVSESNALKFPELYHELQQRRYLSVKTFLVWSWKALYQGAVIMLGGILLFESRFVHVTGITFTSLILTENLMVCVEIKRWHPLMLLAQVLSMFLYAGCLIGLSSEGMNGTSEIDMNFVLSVPFIWRVAVLTAASTVPIWAGRVISHYCSPKIAAKLS
jgi:phospholipid-translocating ATPase